MHPGAQSWSLIISPHAPQNLLNRAICARTAPCGVARTGRGFRGGRAARTSRDFRGGFVVIEAGARAVELGRC
jgi:hypothetical protein